MYKDSFYFHEKDKPIIQKFEIQYDKYTNMTVPYLNATNQKNRLYTTKYLIQLFIKFRQSQ